MFLMRNDRFALSSRLTLFSRMVMVSSMLLFAGATASTSGQISVSPNVHVSKALAERLQVEVILDADPTRPGRLMACSLIDNAGPNGNPSFMGWGVVVYLTDDGGKSWSKTFEEYSLMDPTCIYSADGTAHLEAFELSGDRLMRLYRSADGGRTWGEPTKLRTSDRPHLTSDRTGGRYHGRVYSHGQVSATGAMDGGRGVSGIRLYTSLDGGRTFGDPVQRESVPPRRTLAPGNGVILSDGTLVMVFAELKEYLNDDGSTQIRDSLIGTSNGRLRVITSSDGGRSLSQATTVSDQYMHVYPWRPPAGFLPWMAVDSSGGPFKDRIYVVWPDRRSGRDEILLSYSNDKGRTWTKPVVINDDRAPAAGQSGPDHFMPVIAVNKDGVVGVSWYDRRDHGDNLGWDIRFSASLDGGDTWSPNVKVSEKPNTFTKGNSWSLLATPVTVGPSSGAASFEVWVNHMMIYGGDTTGIAADLNGAFQLVWTDNRTGTPQLWNSSVSVRGKAERNGDALLASYKDVTPSVQLEILEMRYDRNTGELRARARLKNVGAQAVSGPIKVRVLQVRSDLGVAEILNSENGLKGAGAIWDFTPNLAGGVLPAGQASEPKELRFIVSDVRPFVQGLRLKFGLMQLDMRVLAK